MGLVSPATSCAWVMPAHVYQTCREGWHVSPWRKVKYRDLGSCSSAFYGLIDPRWANALSIPRQQPWHALAAAVH